MELSRRELLRILGVSGAAAVTGAAGARLMLSVPDEIFERISTGPRIETWKNSICSFCPSACGIRVRLIDGIPVRVQGNPNYPLNLGAICPMAEAAVQALFHPDRIRQPMRRSGKRDHGGWTPINREEAVTLIADRLNHLRDAGRPDKLAMVIGDSDQPEGRLASRFMKAFGSPNLFSISNWDISALPVRLTQNLNRAPYFDLPNADLVLNFEGDLLDEALSPVRHNQFYARLRSRQERLRGKLIHIGPHLSRTAANSTEWIPVEPGTSGALALSIAYVLLKDGSYDRDFVRRHTSGFSDWTDERGGQHIGFETLVLERYYPEKGAELTGLSPDKIVDLARAFAVSESGLAVYGLQTAYASNGTFTLWAVYCLNALKGNLGKPGGVLFPDQRPDPISLQVSLDDVARVGLAQPPIGDGIGSVPGISVNTFNRFLNRIEHLPDGSVDTLILHVPDSILETSVLEKSQSVLEKIPFVIASSSWMNRSALTADLVLPEPTMLERWDARLHTPAADFPHFGVQQPVVEPFYEALSFGDLMLDLGHRIGGVVADSVPWTSYKHYIQEHARGIFQDGTGTIVSRSTDYSWIQSLRSRGWQPLNYSTFDEFWDVLLGEGGWWDPERTPSDLRKVLRTPSGKFEFYSRVLKERIDELDQARQQKDGPKFEISRELLVEASGDLLFLPHFEPLRYPREKSAFPYTLLTFPQTTDLEGDGRYLPLLQELSGLHSREYWGLSVEINPLTAERLSIHEDDWVAITSPKGRILAKARIVSTVAPTVVAVPASSAVFRAGPGLESVQPSEVLVDELDLLSGIQSRCSTRVQIQKIQV